MAEEESPQADDRPVSKVYRALDYRRVLADASVVEATEEGLELTFLVRSPTPVAVNWALDHTQPEMVRLSRRVEEQMCVRLSVASANDLALNIILETAEAFGVDLEALEKNFEIIRKRIQGSEDEQ